MQRRRAHAAGHVDDRDERLGLQGGGHRQLLVALVRGLQGPRGRRLVRAGDPLPRRARPAEHPAGRLLPAGERLHVGRVLVADRSDAQHRLHRGRLPRRRRAPHRSEGRPLHDVDAHRARSPLPGSPTTPAYLASDTWQFACPWTGVVARRIASSRTTSPGHPRYRPSMRFAPTDVGFIADPYRDYEELRRSAPVVYDEATDHWLISRYARRRRAPARSPVRPHLPPHVVPRGDGQADAAGLARAVLGPDQRRDPGHGAARPHPRAQARRRRRSRPGSSSPSGPASTRSSTGCSTRWRAPESSTCCRRWPSRSRSS